MLLDSELENQVQGVECCKAEITDVLFALFHEQESFKFPESHKHIRTSNLMICFVYSTYTYRYRLRVHQIITWFHSFVFSPMTFKKAVCTCSVRSAACKLLPFSLKASLEHSLVIALPPKAARANNSEALRSFS
jgi:hypothetical protein